MTTRENAGGMCRLEWGHRGSLSAAERRDVLVIVDTLSFSTTAVTAAAQGVPVYPCIDQEDALRCGGQRNVEIAVRREHVPSAGRFSLSPLTFLSYDRPTGVALPSPNGAACCRLGRSSSCVIVACLLNAGAAARVASLLAFEHQVDITVLACGERWSEPADEGDLRFALEDYLGAGAVLAALDKPHSADAAVCCAAYKSVRQDLPRLISECPSGVELRERGWTGDVEHACRLDLYDCVPVLVDDCLVTYTG